MDRACGDGGEHRPMVAWCVGGEGCCEHCCESCLFLHQTFWILRSLKRRAIFDTGNCCDEEWEEVGAVDLAVRQRMADFLLCCEGSNIQGRLRMGCSL